MSAVTLPRDEFALPAANPWTRLPAIGAGVAVLGAVLSAVFAQGQHEQFAFSWLVAFSYFLSIALGCLYFVLIHFATQAGWGIVVRRLAENAAATVPIFALLFLPIAFNLQSLYPWSRPELVATDHLLQLKQPYLNAGFFFVRAAVFFAVWSGIAWWFLSRSQSQDSHTDLGLSARLRRFSGPALIPLALTHHLASVDWLMSLDPHWYSTMFGVYCFAGAFVAAFAFITLVALGLQRSGLLREAINAEHYHDLGKLLFAFTVFWAYIGFSQYFLIWYSNMPEETIFFRQRMEGSWQAASMLLAIGHFGVPFFFLMPRTVKRNPLGLAAGATWLLLMHLVDVYWLAMPLYHVQGVHVGVLDVAALLAVGGCFIALFGWLLRRHALVPAGDPRLPESLGFENV
jgi:hypothetical protein